ncbi:Hypothetical predicted protein [Lecanosticta acicola]|uniref:Uncharacterized protein n=1 Tax=Lecanosticta acicola TaxID=111012 RepID=A0AAI8YXK5_9PEZI|nr:Hypothetical predicted protein [Lecanosticta acicola]
MFAAILGQLMTAIASTQLERGTSIELLEHLLGTRSLGSAVLVVAKFRIMNIWLPFIIAAWLLSPLGGQSSLRLVFSGPLYHNTNTSFHYLDTRLSNPALQGADDANFLNPSIRSTFMAALSAPSSLKNSSQDIYGNIHIPQLEAITSEPALDGWYNVSSFSGPYVSLLGIPVAGIAPDVNSTFTLETSYFTLECGFGTGQVWNSSNGCPDCTTDTFASETINNPEPIRNFKIRENFVDHVDLSVPATIELQSRYTTDDTGRYIVHASCPIRTSYVEAAVECQHTSSNCAVTRIRRSTLSHPPATETTFDCSMRIDRGSICPQNIRLLFFSGLMNTVPTPIDGEYSALERFFVLPDSPFDLYQQAVDLGSVSNVLFSRRFAQLLNTYWLVYVGPFAVAGNFSSAADGTGADGYGDDSYVATASEGTRQSMEIVLYFDPVWAICLVLVSFFLITAGLLTAYLEATRKGPSVLDTFLSSQRDNPYTSVHRDNPMEDGADTVRRSRYQKIQLGDVMPLEEVGHVSIATAGADQPVKRLNKWRLYR